MSDLASIFDDFLEMASGVSETFASGIEDIFGGSHGSSGATSTTAAQIAAAKRQARGRLVKAMANEAEVSLERLVSCTMDELDELARDIALDGGSAAICARTIVKDLFANHGLTDDITPECWLARLQAATLGPDSSPGRTGAFGLQPTFAQQCLPPSLAAQSALALSLLKSFERAQSLGWSSTQCGGNTADSSQGLWDYLCASTNTVVEPMKQRQAELNNLQNLLDAWQD